MSIPYGDAIALAYQAAAVLRPTLSRLETVGSLRRQKMRVGDIEFLVEPHYDSDMFGAATPILEPVKAALLRMGTWVKGRERQMVITDLLGKPGPEARTIHRASAESVGLPAGHPDRAAGAEPPLCERDA